jgi:SAM-dependent methyltransferase
VAASIAPCPRPPPRATPCPSSSPPARCAKAANGANSCASPRSGTDVSDYAVAQCRKLGVRAERGTLDALPFDAAEFAIVTMKHVLEHMPDPRRTLAEVHRVLRLGGALFIAIPDAQGILVGRDSGMNPVSRCHVRVITDAAVAV